MMTPTDPRTWDLADPLARVRIDNSIEPATANQALRDYALLGPGRSLSTLWKWYRRETGEGSDSDHLRLDPYPAGRIPPTRRLSTLRKWSVKFQWVSRVGDWELLKNEQLERLWEERAAQVRTFDWDAAQELRQKVGDFLDLMKDFTERQEGFTTDPDTGERIKVVTLALNFSLGELARVLKVSSELQRLATELPTTIDTLSGAALDTLIESALDERSKLEEPRHGGQARPTGAGHGSEPGTEDTSG
jgi:hypothetical protein